MVKDDFSKVELDYLETLRHSERMELDSEKMERYDLLPDDTKKYINPKYIRNICLSYRQATKDGREIEFFQNFNKGKLYKIFRGFAEYYGSNGLFKIGLKTYDEEERRLYVDAQWAFTALMNDIRANVIIPYVSAFKGLIGTKKSDDTEAKFRKVVTSVPVKDESGEFQEALFYNLGDEFGKKRNFYFRKYKSILEFLESHKSSPLSSTAVSQIEREYVVIDSDNEDKNGNPFFHTQEEVKAFIAKINDEFLPISHYRIKSNLHFQIGWRLRSPITIYNDDGYYVREHNPFHTAYKILFQNLNEMYCGDLHFTGFVFQNPFYTDKNIIDKKVYKENVYDFQQIVRRYNEIAKALNDKNANTENRLYEIIPPIDKIYCRNNYGLDSLYSRINCVDKMVDTQEDFDSYMLAKKLYDEYSSKIPFMTTPTLHTSEPVLDYLEKVDSANKEITFRNNYLQLMQDIKDFNVSEETRSLIIDRYTKFQNVVIDGRTIRTNLEVLYSDNPADIHIIPDSNLMSAYNKADMQLKEYSKKVEKESINAAKKKLATNRKSALDNLTYYLETSGLNIYNQRFLSSSRMITLCNWTYTLYMRETRKLSLQASQDNGKVTIVYPNNKDIIDIATTKYYPYICDILNKHSNKASSKEILASILDSIKKAKSQFVLRTSAPKKLFNDEDLKKFYNETLIKMQNKENIDQDELYRKSKYLLSKSNSEIFYTDTQREFAALIHYTNKLCKVFEIRDYFANNENASYRNFLYSKKDKKESLKGYSIGNISYLYRTALSIEDYIKVSYYYKKFYDVMLLKGVVYSQKCVYDKLLYLKNRFDEVFDFSLEELVKTGDLSLLKIKSNELFRDRDYEVSMQYLNTINSEVFVDKDNKQDKEYQKSLSQFIILHTILRQTIRGRIKEIANITYRQFLDSNHSKIFQV